MNKFEQLIEFVINDEQEKARELFHDIVVEKSRSIYESMMAEEEDLDDESEDVSEGLGGDQADDLITDVECEEEGISMEGEEDEAEVEFDDKAEEAGDDLTGDIEAMGDEEGKGELEDRVVDLEDKLDDLMAEFEALLGDGEGGEDMAGDEFGDVEGDLEDAEGGEETEIDDTEFETESLEEAVTLQKAPAPKTSEESFVNKKSVNDNNSGQAGMEAKPVKTSGAQETGRAAPSAGQLGDAKYQNSVGGNKTLSAAPKAVTSQASGVNTRTPFPKQ